MRRKAQKDSKKRKKAAKYHKKALLNIFLTKKLLFAEKKYILI
jgi:hypothetical protein